MRYGSVGSASGLTPTQELTPSELEMEQAFGYIDSDRSGEIDFDEFAFAKWLSIKDEVEGVIRGASEFQDFAQV